MFLIKYDGDGNRQWVRLLGAAGERTRGRAIAVDGSDNLYVTGFTRVGLDGNALMGGEDLFVTKYTSSGNREWTRQLGVGVNFTQGHAIAADADGNSYAVGYTDGNLDGEILTGTLDALVTKYDTLGNKQWTRLLGVATKNTYGLAATVDASGTLYIAGDTFGALPGNDLAGMRDAFVASYSANGIRQWVTQFGEPMGQILVFGLAADPAGNLFASGYTTVGLDGNTQVGNQDLFIASFTGSGEKQ